MIDLEQLAVAFTNMGATPESARLMASQLDKRAHQLAETTGKTYEEALVHLLKIVQKAGEGG